MVELNLHKFRRRFLSLTIGTLLFIVAPTGVRTLPRNKVTPAAVEDGNLMLGALMMVHERENEPLTCGDVMPQGGVQAVEAMLFTLDWINRNKIVPYTKLGARILDDCDKDTYGLQQAVEFIKGKMGSLQSGYTCTYANSSVKVSTKPITGVVAASSSVTSIQVANLLKLFKIPQVSYFSTSAELSSRERYPYFFRTIPSDAWQVEAMRDIILKFNWTYVSIVYEESSYGKVAMSNLEDKLSAHNVCIAIREKLPKDSDVAKEKEYEFIVDMLKSKPQARGVVVYGSDQEVQGLVRAIRSRKATGWFTLIGSDGWSAREIVYEGGYEKEVLGTVSVQPMAADIEGFREYFEKQTVESNERNPWFYEMWEREFKCKYLGKPVSIYNQNFTKNCTGYENQAPNAYAYEQQLQFVSDATMVFAYALKDYFEAECSGSKDFKQCVQCYHNFDSDNACEIDGELLRDFIQNVSFTGLAKNQFKFDVGKAADPAPFYKIIHFRSNEKSRLSPGRRMHGDQVAKPYEWVQVGTWNRELSLDLSRLEFVVNKSGRMTTIKKVPPSFCKSACQPDQIRIIPSDGDKCCWNCQTCQKYQYKCSENQCCECRNGTKSKSDFSDCVEIPAVMVTVISAYGIVCTIIAVLGTVGTVFILGIFLKNHETPVVKASGRELSYVILFGLLLCFAVTPLTLLPPTEVSCGVQRFLAGFCFTVVYSAILTKTNRIARIFKSGRRTIRRPNFISPESQLIICAGITSVQILLVGLWLNAYPPKARSIYPTREDNLLVCLETVSSRYFMAYAYPIFLCIVCTIYAYKTRKMPEAFNESRYIGAAVYTTCIIWLAFVPVYIVAKDSTPIRVTSVCISTSLTALVVQFCLFWPKVYIIMFKPDKNVRQSIMGSKSGSVCKSLLPPAPNNSVLMNNSTLANLYKQDRSDSSCYSDDDFLQLSSGRHKASVGPVQPKVNVGTQTGYLRDSESLTFIDKIAKTECAPLPQPQIQPPPPPVMVTSVDNLASEDVEWIDKDEVTTPTTNGKPATFVANNCVNRREVNVDDDVPL